MKSEELRKISYQSKAKLSENHLKDIDKVIRETTPKILKMFDDELLEMARSGKMVYTLEQKAPYGQPFSLFEQIGIGALEPVYWSFMFIPEFNELLNDWTKTNKVYMDVTARLTNGNSHFFTQWNIKIDIRKHGKIYQLGRRLMGGNEYMRVSVISHKGPYYEYKRFKKNTAITRRDKIDA